MQPDGSYDNLDLAVHVLYDDCVVLPDPAASVPTLLTSDEVDSFRRLDDAFGPMLDELGDVADDIYLADPRWPAVVEAARAAHEMMRTTDDNRTTRP